MIMHLLFSFLALVDITLGHNAISKCEVDKLFLRYNLSSLPFNDTKSDIYDIDTEKSPPGVLLTAWAGPPSSSPLFKYSCHIKTHVSYCEKHGYKHVFFEDTVDMERARNVYRNPPHWIKVQALMHILDQLPRHPWVLYVDSDTVIFDSPAENNTSIESFLKGFEYDKSTTSIILPGTHEINLIFDITSLKHVVRAVCCCRWEERLEH
jgi:hypothetical protein